MELRFFLNYFDLKSSILYELYQVNYKFQSLNRNSMSIDAQMIKFLNVARQLPSYYIALIDQQLSNFINQKQMTVSQQVVYQTNQGKITWLQARAFLEKQQSIPPLESNQGLFRSTNDHAKDLAKHQLFGHIGSDKSTFSQRILRYCRKGSGAMAQMVGADFVLKNRNNAEMTILGLIIDDGVPDRGHRKTIFCSEYKYVGCRSEIMGDKMITVFNLTQHRLLLKSQTPNFGNTVQSSNYHTYPSRQAPSEQKQFLTHSGNNNFNRNPTQYSQPAKQDRSLRDNSHSQSFKGNFGATGNSQFTGTGMRKISEKKENTRVYYEEGNKVTEKTVSIIYSDGTTESNFEKHTTFG